MSEIDTEELELERFTDAEFTESSYDGDQAPAEYPGDAFVALAYELIAGLENVEFNSQEYLQDSFDAMNYLISGKALGLSDHLKNVDKVIEVLQTYLAQPWKPSVTASGRAVLKDRRRPSEKMAYNPSQARAPKGSPVGGQWIETPRGIRDRMNADYRNPDSGTNRALDAAMDKWGTTMKHFASKGSGPWKEQIAQANLAKRYKSGDPTEQTAAAIESFRQNPEKMQEELRAGGELSPMTKTLKESFNDPKTSIDLAEVAGEPVILHRTSYGKVTPGNVDPRDVRAGDILRDDGITTTTTEMQGSWRTALTDRRDTPSTYVEQIIVVPRGVRAQAVGADGALALEPGTNFKVIGKVHEQAKDPREGSWREDSIAPNPSADDGTDFPKPGKVSNRSRVYLEAIPAGANVLDPPPWEPPPAPTLTQGDVDAFKRLGIDVGGDSSGGSENAGTSEGGEK